MSSVRVLLLVMVILLSGCATAWMKNAARFSGPEPEPIGMAVIYIYRPHLEHAQVASPMVFLNDKPVAPLRDNGYTVVVVPPGPYVIRTEKSWGEISDVSLTFNIERPGSYLLKFEHSYSPQVQVRYSKGVVTSSTIWRIDYQRWSFSEPRHRAAWTSIAECYRIPPP